MNAIEVDNLSKSYGKVDALKGVFSDEVGGVSARCDLFVEGLMFSKSLREENSETEQSRTLYVPSENNTSIQLYLAAESITWVSRK